MSSIAESSQDRVITLADVSKVLQAEVVYGDDKLGDEVTSACGSDLMSDVLAFAIPGSVLLTGLTNQQVVRTAEMLDLKAVIIVRNKRPDQDMLQLAQSKGLPILLSHYPLYESCGLLYSIGLKGHDCTKMHNAKDDPPDKKSRSKGNQACATIWLGD